MLSFVAWAGVGIGITLAFGAALGVAYPPWPVPWEGVRALAQIFGRFAELFRLEIGTYENSCFWTWASSTLAEHSASSFATWLIRVLTG